LIALRQGGTIYKFTKKKKIMELCLKKTKVILRRPKQKKRVLRDFDIAAVLYKNPATQIFLSTTFGVCTKSSFALTRGRQKKIGGTPLFLTN
jgi:hypothetical protein